VVLWWWYTTTCCGVVSEEFTFILFCNRRLQWLAAGVTPAAQKKRVACPAGGTPAGLLLHHQVYHLMMQHISTTCGGTPQVVMFPLRIPMQLKAALV